MAGRLQHEIKQNKPFANLREEAYLNLLRSADVLWQAVNGALKGYGISGTQYNVLRILRGAEPDGLACSEIGSRMITRDPDITRLLDRLETRGLVRRQRGDKDRRVIVTRITSSGMHLLVDLDKPVTALLEEKLGHFGIQKLRTLIELLELARAS